MGARGKYLKYQDERYAEDSKDQFKPFAEALNSLMEEKGITNEILAAAIGKSKSAISHYLSAKSSPDVETLAAIRNYFGVSYDYLLGASKVKSPDPDMQASQQLFGLSEEALVYIASTYQPMKEVLDSLLCSEEGHNLLSSCVAVKMMYSSISERVKEYNLHPATMEDWYTTLSKLTDSVDSVDVMMFRLSRSFEKWSDALSGYEALRSDIEMCYKELQAAETEITK